MKYLFGENETNTIKSTILINIFQASEASFCGSPGHSSKRNRSVVMFCCLMLLFLLAMSVVEISAQPGEYDPKRGTQSGGQFAIGNFETINISNGNLMLNFPLGSLPGGRGGLNAGISLFYNSKLYDKTTKRIRDERYECQLTEGGNENWLEVCRYYNRLEYFANEKGGWSYGFGFKLEVESRLDQFGPEVPPCRDSVYQSMLSNWTELTYIHKLFIVFPDGSRHELIPSGHLDVLYDRYFRVRMDGTIENCGGPAGGGPRPVYYSVDGSFLRLESTANSWTLTLQDGSKVVNTNGQPQRVYDRNNNYVEFRTVANFEGSGRSANQVADEFGRSVTIFRPNPSIPEDEIRTKGVNGADVVWKVRWKEVYSQKYYYSCPNDGGYSCPETEIKLPLSQQHIVVDKIIEPVQMGSKEYVFGYNGATTFPPSGQITTGLGEVNSITVPSGAQTTYSYSRDGMGTFAVPFEFLEGADDEILSNSASMKTLSYNQEYDGVLIPTNEKWLYSSSRYGGSVISPDGSSSSTQTFDSLGNSWDAGLTQKTTNPDGSVTENVWAKNQPVNCQSLDFSCLNRANPYLKTQYVSIKDNSGNFTLTSITDYQVDKNGNPTQIVAYDWISYSSVPRNQFGAITGLPSGLTPAKIVNTAYYAETPEASVVSSDPDIYVFPSSPRSKQLPKSSEIRNAVSQVVSRNEMYYDNPSTTGNLIQTKTWDSSKGAYSNPLNAGNSVASGVQYNQYGMPVLTTDAKGIQTQITYGAVGGFSDLYPTLVKTAYNLPEQRTSASTYDFHTGLVKTSTDVDNGVTNETVYDSIGRPLVQKAAINSPNEVWTQTEYNDQLRRVVVKSDLFVKGDAKKVAIQHFDQLGRVRLSRTLEDAATQNPYNEADGIKVQTRYRYDNGANPTTSNGTFTLQSNPYRTGNDAEMGWTVSYSDKTGKTSTTKTYSGGSLPAPWGGNANITGTVLSQIDANTSTVTDQAGKQRRSISNGLGQLVRVDEPNDAGSLGTVSAPVQATSYLYDTLNNLVQVNQGVQQRNFSYNSLGRLMTATNPESGTISYGYDNNGNLTQKTDARGVVTTYVYDNINRVVSRSYSDGTPAVSYTYENVAIPFSKGRLTKVSSSISETRYNQFDNLGRVLSSTQITDGQTYNFGYQYNLSGALVAQTYPSGRVVSNVLENDGDLAQVNGSFQNQSKTYVGNFTYTSAGAVTNLQLGNGKWENTVFNSRLQPIQIGLGNSQNTQDLWKINYDYGTTDNNGNVKGQTITVPGQFTAVQNYTYDSLNRLKSATETISGSQIWKQTFLFDRYGNRNFDPAQTTTLGNCPANVCNPAINAANNRIVGQIFDNAGNTTVDAEGRQFFYDAENKQKEVRNAQNQIIGQYLYDGDGKRVKKLAANDTTIFVYDAAGLLAAEYLITASQPQAPTTSYLTNDTLGSPRVTTDSSGNVLSRRDFRPYGEEIYRPNQGTDKVRQKFTSYERDNETELDFAQARYFASSLGRFSNPDPLLINLQPWNPQGWNMYIYVLNNPLLLIDPTGLIWGISGKQVQWFADNTAMEQAGFEAFTPIDWTYFSDDGRWISLNPDGPRANSGAYDPTHPYFANGWSVSSDPSTWDRIPGHGLQDASLETLSLIYGAVGIVKVGVKSIGAALTRQVAMEGAEVIANGVTRQMLQTAAADSGPVVNVVSKLAQSPQVGRSLYVWEDGTVGVANQAISGGSVFTAQIPKALIETLRSAGLVRSETTLMNGVQQTALKFEPLASQYIVPFFKAVNK